VELFSRRLYRDPFGEVILPDAPPMLTADQEAVVSTVSGSLGKGFRTFLLKGVTGSGKTEVYMRWRPTRWPPGIRCWCWFPEDRADHPDGKTVSRAIRGNRSPRPSQRNFPQGSASTQWVRILRRECPSPSRAVGGVRPVFRQSG